jgi:hypothetical protein
MTKLSQTLTKMFNPQAALALAVLALFLIPTQVIAMSISPVRIEMQGDPGQSLKGVFKIINDEADNKVFYTAYENFEASGETGNPNFVETNTGLSTWINAASQVLVASGESVEVPFTVTIPSNAEPGGYFAAIFLSTVPPNTSGGGQVVIGARIGTLVLLRVNGEIKEGGALLEFGTKEGGKLFTSLPVEFYYRFQNSGADRVRPVGNVVIRNTIGMTSKVVNANVSQGNVLPSSIRRFELAWVDAGNPNDQAIDASIPESASGKSFFQAAGLQLKNFAFGRYTAQLAVAYGADNSVEVSKTSFYVFPWQLLLIVLIGGTILYFSLSRGVRFYNAWIIKKARLK